VSQVIGTCRPANDVRGEPVGGIALGLIDDDAVAVTKASEHAPEAQNLHVVTGVESKLVQQEDGRVTCQNISAWERGGR
jgi:hypothetical protein